MAVSESDLPNPTFACPPRRPRAVPPPLRGHSAEPLAGHRRRPSLTPNAMAQTRRLCARLTLYLFALLFISPLLLARVDAAPPSASASAATALPASASASTSAPLATCVFSTPAGTFDLAPLGAVHADSPQDGGATWSALFGACADLDASAASGLCGSAAPAPAPAPALLMEGGACHALGRRAQRSVAPLAANSSGSRRVGVTVAFGGGDACGNGTLARSASIDVVCTDVAHASAVRVAEGGTGRACAVAASVESRAGCPLECARDAATGAVCGGEDRGSCVAGVSVDGGLARCVCAKGFAGAACEGRARPRALSADVAGSALRAPNASSGSLPAAALVLAVLIALIGRSMSSAAPQPNSQLKPLTMKFIVAALLFVVLESCISQAPFSLGLRASVSSACPPRADALATINSADVNYDDYKRAIGPAPFPTRAFMITTRAAQESGRTAHAVEQVRQHLNITDIQFVLGRNELLQEDFGCDTRLASAVKEPIRCRVGLGWAMHQVWKAISYSGVPGFFLEDDVLFHDNFATLLPLYWAKVPPAYEIVYLGSAPRWLITDGPSTPPAEPVRFGIPPLALHCAALTAASAARFAALYTQMFRLRGWTEEPSVPELNHNDVNGDTFLESFAFPTALNKQMWVSFESTLATPAEFRGIVFRDEWKRTVSLFEQKGCKCDNEYTPECRGFLPVVCVGLAFQNYHCNNITRMYSWIAHYKEDMLSSAPNASATPPAA